MKEKLLQRFQNMQEEMDSSHRTGSTGIECIKTWHQTWIEGYLAFQLGCPPASTNNAWKPGSLLVALTTSIESKQWAYQHLKKLVANNPGSSDWVGRDRVINTWHQLLYWVLAYSVLNLAGSREYRQIVLSFTAWSTGIEWLTLGLALTQRRKSIIGSISSVSTVIRPHKL